MAKPANGTSVLGYVCPIDTTSTYPAHSEEWGRGGYRSVAIIEERDAIPMERRKEGMLVNVTGSNEIFKLQGGIANSNWKIWDSINIKGIEHLGKVDIDDIGNGDYTYEDGNVLESYTYRLIQVSGGGVGTVKTYQYRFNSYLTTPTIEYRFKEGLFGSWSTWTSIINDIPDTDNFVLNDWNDKPIDIKAYDGSMVCSITTPVDVYDTMRFERLCDSSGYNNGVYLTYYDGLILGTDTASAYYVKDYNGTFPVDPDREIAVKGDIPDSSYFIKNGTNGTPVRIASSYVELASSGIISLLSPEIQIPGFSKLSIGDGYPYGTDLLWNPDTSTTEIKSDYPIDLSSQLSLYLTSYQGDINMYTATGGIYLNGHDQLYLNNENSSIHLDNTGNIKFDAFKDILISSEESIKLTQGGVDVLLSSYDGLYLTSYHGPLIESTHHYTRYHGANGNELITSYDDVTVLSAPKFDIWVDDYKMIEVSNKMNPMGYLVMGSYPSMDSNDIGIEFKSYFDDEKSAAIAYSPHLSLLYLENYNGNIDIYTGGKLNYNDNEVATVDKIPNTSEFVKNGCNASNIVIEVNGDDGINLYKTVQSGNNVSASYLIFNPNFYANGIARDSMLQNINTGGSIYLLSDGSTIINSYSSNSEDAQYITNGKAKTYYINDALVGDSNAEEYILDREDREIAVKGDLSYFEREVTFAGNIYFINQYSTNNPGDSARIAVMDNVTGFMRTMTKADFKAWLNS